VIQIGTVDLAQESVRRNHGDPPDHASQAAAGPAECQSSPMTSLQAAEWHDMFVAIAAAAALTGLLFVAVSINLTRILEFEILPTRAVETLSIMIGLLLLSVIMLVPGQGSTLLGAEILVLGVVLTAVLLPKRLRIPRNKAEPLRQHDGQLRTDCSHNLARYAPFGVTQSV
jgi:hypothetical protein